MNRKITSSFVRYFGLFIMLFVLLFLVVGFGVTGRISWFVIVAVLITVFMTVLYFSAVDIVKDRSCLFVKRPFARKIIYQTSEVASVRRIMGQLYCIGFKDGSQYVFFIGLSDYFKELTNAGYVWELISSKEED